jgi:P-type Mg2+ transporter
VRLVRRFMITFGLLSSIFDYLTFGALLLLVGRADRAAFRTAWFVESVISAASVVLVVRTRRPAWRSRPGRGLARATAACVALTAALPFTPLAPVLGFAPLRPAVAALLAAIVVAYLASAEWAKRRFYASAANGA